MREILFRGKDNKGAWHRGFYCVFEQKEEHRIYIGYGETNESGRSPNYWKVNPNTIGQYTGLTDKNDRKIFEGDIVLLCDDEEPYQVAFDECCFQVFDSGVCYNMDCFRSEDIEIIGNIYDNPELLRGDTR